MQFIFFTWLAIEIVLGIMCGFNNESVLLNWFVDSFLECEFINTFYYILLFFSLLPCVLAQIIVIGIKKLIKNISNKRYIDNDSYTDWHWD